MKAKPQATFKIDGNADPKRPVTSWVEGKVPRTREGWAVYGQFDGATAQDMPQ